MKVTVHDIEQRTPEWTALRLGRLTGSRAADMATPNTSKGEAAARRNLRVQLMLERITGRAQERNYQTQAMKDGIEREPFAMAYYEAQTGISVWPVGFIASDELMAGCSPDGLIGEDGILSIKSPIPATHLEYLKTGTVPKDYLQQILHEMWITGRKWCDWISFQPDFPEGTQLKMVRVFRHEGSVAEYDRLARVFLAEVDTEVQAFKTAHNLTAQLEESVA